MALVFEGFLFVFSSICLGFTIIFNMKIITLKCEEGVEWRRMSKKYLVVWVPHFYQ